MLILERLLKGLSSRSVEVRAKQIEDIIRRNTLFSFKRSSTQATALEVEIASKVQKTIHEENTQTRVVVSIAAIGLLYLSNLPIHELGLGMLMFGVVATHQLLAGFNEWRNIRNFVG